MGSLLDTNVDVIYSGKRTNLYDFVVVNGHLCGVVLDEGKFKAVNVEHIELYKEKNDDESGSNAGRVSEIVGTASGRGDNTAVGQISAAVSGGQADLRSKEEGSKRTKLFGRKA